MEDKTRERITAPCPVFVFFVKCSQTKGEGIFENTESSLQSVSSRRRFQVVIMATGAFAVPSIRALCECDSIEIVCLVTSPLRYDKNGNPMVTPARKVAAEYRIPITYHENVNTKDFADFLYLVRPDLFFVCDFGQILSRQTLFGSILGGINLHGSLLPRFRGAAPVHWAILTGEADTGVSIIHMIPQVDAGPVIAQTPPIPISPHETVIELEERLAEYGAKLVLATVVEMALGKTVRIIEQLHDRVSKAPRFTKESGLVPWNRSSQEIYNHCRAMVPWPRSFTHWGREKGSPLRLILGEVSPLDDALEELVFENFAQTSYDAPLLFDAKMDNLAELKSTPKIMSVVSKPSDFQRPAWWQPGVVILAKGNDLIVAAEKGAIRIKQIQPAGKKMMQVHEFLRGYPIKQGNRLE